MGVSSKDAIILSDYRVSGTSWLLPEPTFPTGQALCCAGSKQTLWKARVVLGAYKSPANRNEWNCFSDVSTPREILSS